MSQKKSRAAWNSFESITRFTWSGSAFLGGFLVEQYSFKFCFLVTAIIYTLSTAIFFVLLAADIPAEKRSLVLNEDENDVEDVHLDSKSEYTTLQGNRSVNSAARYTKL